MIVDMKFDPIVIQVVSDAFGITKEGARAYDTVVLGAEHDSTSSDAFPDQDQHQGPPGQAPIYSHAMIAIRAVHQKTCLDHRAKTIAIQSMLLTRRSQGYDTAD